MEKTKQDDSLSELSNVLGELKNMAIDMGSELERLVVDVQSATCFTLIYISREIIMVALDFVAVKTKVWIILKMMWMC